MVTCTAPIVPDKPTASETSLAQRQRIIDLTEAGWSAAAIGQRLALSPRQVYRWRSRYREQGAAGLVYRSRRPPTPPPHTLPAPVVAAIDAIRSAHPGWGYRLIHRQLLLEQVRPLPHERTVQRWLTRLGHPTVRPASHKPVGFPQPPARADDTVWELEHKEKGECGI